MSMPSGINKATSQSDEHDEELFSITQLANEFGISTRAIRFYESKGLLSPDRVGSTRVFRKRDRVRLLLILRGKRLGFSIRDISEYLTLYDNDSTQTSQVIMLKSKVEERLKLLENQLDDLQITIAELNKIHELACMQLRNV